LRQDRLARRRGSSAIFRGSRKLNAIRHTQAFSRKCLCTLVMLRLHVPYVSKPTIFRGLGDSSSRPENKVPIEFQGLGVASQRRFPSANSASLKSAFVADENPNVSGVAGRYATALFELARDERSIDSIKADLDRFDAMITESADLNRLVRSPVFTSVEQSKALSAVLERAGIGGISANFLKLLTANRRLFVVRDVIRTFRTLVAHFKGEVTADVTVAEQLSDKNLDALKGALKSVTGKDVDLNVKVDPAIIGGLIVKVGSRMVDSSLRTKLNSIKNAMKEAG
jgi:F-type H+-transporting ATPase subunit delta